MSFSSYEISQIISGIVGRMLQQRSDMLDKIYDKSLIKNSTNLKDIIEMDCYLDQVIQLGKYWEKNPDKSLSEALGGWYDTTINGNELFIEMVKCDGKSPSLAKTIKYINLASTSTGYHVIKYIANDIIEKYKEKGEFEF